MAAHLTLLGFWILVLLLLIKILLFIKKLIIIMLRKYEYLEVMSHIKWMTGIEIRKALRAAGKRELADTSVFYTIMSKLEDEGRVEHHVSPGANGMSVHEYRQRT